MEYNDIKEFGKKTRKGKSTIYRFYKKYGYLWDETRLDKKRLFPDSHIKYFNSEILFDENQVLKQENETMKRLIDCLMDKENLQQKLWKMDWSYFFTVAYKKERNKKSCFRQMHSMSEMLIKKYGDESEIRLFFTTEPFSNRKGYHNHFVIHIENKRLEEQIIEEICSFFEYDRVDFNRYDKYKAGIFYIAKGGLVNEDWDILGNNLGDEAVKNAD